MQTLWNIPLIEDNSIRSDYEVLDERKHTAQHFIRYIA